LSSETQKSRPEKETGCRFLKFARDPRPVDLANTPAASPPPFLARSRKALRASAGACNVLPAYAEFLPLSFIVIGRLFPAGHAASRSGSPDIGAACCPVRSDFRCDPAQTSSQHPEPLAGRKTGNQSEPWLPPACCAARDPGTGFGGQRSGTPFRSPAHPGLRQFQTRNSGRLSSRQSRLDTAHHYPWQAPGSAVMPGFAAAKPGTGQTARAIIAPASCRHDNCNARCLISTLIRPCLSPAHAGSTPPGLCIAPLRPLPAGSPAGPALHNKTLCKLARGNDEPHAANAATALERHTPRVLSRCQGSGSFAASTPATSRKALRASAGRCNAHLPRPSLYYCHLLSFFRLFAHHCLSRRVIWTLCPCAKQY